MKVRRSLIDLGGSRGVTIPVDWLKYHEEKRGKPVTDLELDMDNESITIRVAENGNGHSQETQDKS